MTHEPNAKTNETAISTSYRHKVIETKVNLQNIPQNVSLGVLTIRGRHLERKSKRPVHYALSSPSEVSEEGRKVTYHDIVIIIISSSISVILIITTISVIIIKVR
jgi:hypothetical protein